MAGKMTSTECIGVAVVERQQGVVLMLDCCLALTFTRAKQG